MPNFSVIIPHILNIVILYLILRYLLYKPVKAFMAARSGRITGELDKARLMQEEAQKVTDQAAAILEAAREESRGVINQAAQKAKEDADGILAMAAEKAREIEAQAREDALLEQAHLREDLQTQVSELALQMAGSILRREVRAADNTAIIEGFFAESSVFDLARREQQL